MKLECPYCEKKLDINHDDGFSYEEDVKHEIECPHCEKRFVFTIQISFSYKAEKADCLNDGKHDYQLTHTFPKELSKMRCSMCGDEREMTDEERISFEIGTVAEYIESLK